MPFLGSEGKRQLKAFGRVGTVGIELVVSILIGFFGGRWLDGTFGTEPWLMWLGFGLGLVAGFRSLYHLARRMLKDLERDEPFDGER